MTVTFIKRWRRAGWLALFSLVLLTGLAQTHALAADEVAVPALTQRVTDLTATLSPQDQQALENQLAQVEQQYGSQIAILLVPTTQPEAIEQFSLRVVEAWQLGRQKVDDGILILLAKDDRKMRIEVGYGLEGAIPDVIAKRIIAETMAPRFQQGDFAGGLAAAVDQLARLLAGEQLPAPKAGKANQGLGDEVSENLLPLLLFGVVAIGGALRAMLGSFLGGTVTGGLVGFAVWVLGGGVLLALVLGVVALVMTMTGISSMLPMLMGSGGGGGGGFRGGGGRFGGGGASGGW